MSRIKQFPIRKQLRILEHRIQKLRKNTGSSSNNDVSEIKPYLPTKTKNINKDIQSTFVIEGCGNIDNDTIFNINSNNAILDSVIVESPTKLIVTITPNGTSDIFTLLAKNGNEENFGVFTIQTKVETILIPGDTTPWLNVNANLHAGVGEIYPTTTSGGWKKAFFGTIPSEADFELSFTFDKHGRDDGYIAFGISSYMDNSNISYANIDNYFYMSYSNNYFREKNTQVLALQGIAQTDDVFMIKRVDGIISYYKNGVFLRNAATNYQGECYISYSTYIYYGMKNINVKYL